MLDHPRDYWSARLVEEQLATNPALDAELWMDRMDGYVVNGCAFDLEENEDQMRCVSAPVRRT